MREPFSYPRFSLDFFNQMFVQKCVRRTPNASSSAHSLRSNDSELVYARWNLTTKLISVPVYFQCYALNPLESNWMNLYTGPVEHLGQNAVIQIECV